MKKVLLIIALAMFSFANAQKGSILVMGSIEYSSQNTSNRGYENKDNNFGFAPKVGYQFHQDWTVGLEAGTYTSKEEWNTGEYKSNNFSLGAFLRYEKALNQTFSAYADLGVGFQNSTVKRRDGFNRYKNEGDGFYIDITPAILINVTKTVGLNFNIGGIGYNTLNFDGSNGNGDNVKTFDFSFGKAFSVGVSKKF